MNKFNNPRLTNTTVSGTGVKHPMRPHVILGDPENGFIRGDLLDANAVIKLIKNAAKAIGALEELEQSNWIDDDAKTEEPAEETVGVLQPGEVGFLEVDSGKRILIFNEDGAPKPVAYAQGQSTLGVQIVDSKAFRMTVAAAMDAGYITPDDTPVLSGKPYTEIVNLVIKYATIG